MSAPPHLQRCDPGCHALSFTDWAKHCLGMQITSSQHLDAKKVLLRVPMEAKDFLETRALLLELLGRHQDALEYAPS